MNLWGAKDGIAARPIMGPLVGLAALAPALLAGAQSPVFQAPSEKVFGPRMLLTSAGTAAEQDLGRSRIVRTIDDPAAGVRWLLVRDAEHPSGPGRLVRTASAPAEMKASQPNGTLTSAPDATGATPSVPIIRAGAPLVVEEHSVVADVRLEAVALGPALSGSEFEVRLKIGGRVFRAVALAPGRAVLEQQPEVRP